MRKLLNTLYVTNQDARLVKSENNLSIMVEECEVLKVPFHLLESVVCFGYRGCSPAVLGTCAQMGITISFLDGQGRFLARVDGPISGNVLLRRAQYDRSREVDCSLEVAKRFVEAKIINEFRVLERYRRDYPSDITSVFSEAIDLLRSKANGVSDAETACQLRGVEGDAAHLYFSVFNELIRVDDSFFKFSGRNRRPPKDAVNALLSFFYSLLSRDISAACESVGLDPQVGFFHSDRPGRSSLSLDLIEELRAPYVDRFVLSLINRRQVSSSDFVVRDDGGVELTNDARREVLKHWQKRKQEKITHPFLKEKIEHGLLPFVQVQLFSRFLRGDIVSYPPYLWR